ncbi:uncharacterized protein LTR77_007622 [Saxophila tyrrhenica]|uniref:Uncharacterized protein n=1 Tax=Saxophila tyrrhenica TaxID=1690608 RepID=A0AAV9P391_9PEZI|nr:hypothetical protein LTR77_007622 [Saxophila tyrrhenica]
MSNGTKPSELKATQDRKQAEQLTRSAVTITDQKERHQKLREALDLEVRAERVLAGSDIPLDGSGFMRTYDGLDLEKVPGLGYHDRGAIFPAAAESSSISTIEGTRTAMPHSGSPAGPKRYLSSGASAVVDNTALQNGKGKATTPPGSPPMIPTTPVRLPTESSGDSMLSAESSIYSPESSVLSRSSASLGSESSRKKPKKLELRSPKKDQSPETKKKPKKIEIRPKT